VRRGLRRGQVHIITAFVFAGVLVHSGRAEEIDLRGRASEALTHAMGKVKDSGVVGRAVMNAESSSRSWLSRQFEGLRAAYEAFNNKLSEAAHVDEQNEILRRRVAALEAENNDLKARTSSSREEARADTIKAAAVAEGGVPTARTIASLRLSDGASMAHPPKVVFEEAVKAFASGDYETSGRALATLIDNSESDDFHTAQAYFLAGVSLYQVGNYKRALQYLSRADAAAKQDDEAYAPRALAWKALCYRKLGEARSENDAIRELIQRYPKSQEARRLNRNA